MFSLIGTDSRRSDRSSHGRALVMRTLVLLLAGVVADADADVYESVASDGSLVYSNHPLDASSSLVQRSDPKAAMPRPSLRPVDPALRALIDAAAKRHSLSPDLITAVIAVESNFDPRARSRRGARGLMQIMPATAARYRVSDSYDPQQNIDAGSRYLKELLRLHGGNLAVALAAYNSGPAAVARHGTRIPPYPETMLYVSAVLARMSRSAASHSSNGTDEPG